MFDARIYSMHAHTNSSSLSAPPREAPLHSTILLQAKVFSFQNSNSQHCHPQWRARPLHTHTGSDTGSVQTKTRNRGSGRPEGCLGRVLARRTAATCWRRVALCRPGKRREGVKLILRTSNKITPSHLTFDTLSAPGKGASDVE